MSETLLNTGIDRRWVLLGAAAALAEGAFKCSSGGNDRSSLPTAPTSTTSVGAPTASGGSLPTTDGTTAGRGGALSLGINLTPISYWTPVVFIDRLKASSAWSAQGAPAPTDAAGYPAGRAAMMTMVPAEPGTYFLSHNGDMDVRVQGGTLTGRRSDGGVYDVRSAAPTGRALIIDAIRKPPTYMRLINQKDATAFASGEIFAPDFLAQVKGFDTLRFMDWMRTNGSKVTDTLPSVDLCSYSPGVPLETMLALAKKIGAHPWICVPHLATDALVQRMIGTLRQAAAGGPAPYLEYSNEVWNLGFEQARYAQQEAASRWGGTTTGGTFYGYRAAQIAKAARGSGVRVVLGAQTVTPGRADNVWDGVRRAGGTDSDFGGWIIATYVNGTLANAGGPTLALAARNDINGAIDNIMHATGSGAFSVDTMSTIYKQQGNIARAHGLPLLAYEGNLHLNPLPNFAPKLNQVTSFFDAITKAPAIAKVTEANLNAFSAAGGSLACLYNLSSGASNGGVFGLVDSGSWGVIQQRLAVQQTAR